MLNYDITVLPTETITLADFAEYLTLDARLNKCVRIELVGDLLVHVTIYMPRKNQIVDLLVWVDYAYLLKILAERNADMYIA